MDVTFDEEKKWFRMERGAISVVSNLGEQVCELPIPQSSQLELASGDEVQIRIAMQSFCLPIRSPC